MPLSAAVDPSRCPLCGGPNTCAEEVARATGRRQEPCWCIRVDFNAELLGQVPPMAKGQACICPACAARAQQA